MRTTAVLACMVCGALLVACGPSQPPAPEAATPGPTNVTGADVRQKTSDALAAVRDYTIEAKDRFVAAANVKLTQWNADFLRHKAETLNGDARTEANKALDSLRQQRVVVNQKLEALKQSSKDAWQQAKADLDLAMAKLEQAYTNAKAKVEKKAS